MKRLLILFTLLILKVTPSVCQKECKTFECAYNEAKRLFNDSKSVDRYGRALVNLEGAENLAGNDENNKKKIRELRAKIIEAITEQNRMLKKATETANLAKDNSEKLLKELRETSDQAVQLLLNEIDRNILRLEYDSNFEKCRIAVNLKSEKYEHQIKERILEIAYFYTETDTTAAAVKILKLLGINAPPNRNDLLAEIQKNASPQYFEALNERYYPKMITVEGGSFELDSDYTVEINSFDLARTETTVWQYNIFVKGMKHRKPETPAWQWSGNNPIVNVAWYDAAFYINWLSDKKGLQKVYDLTNKRGKAPDFDYDVKIDYYKNGFRLPTEAEWEFAGRGGVHHSPYRYSGSDSLNLVAWHSDNSDTQTHPVGKKKSNVLGLCDMTGNVWEWCNDYAKNYDISKTKNPRGAKEGSLRILRGGSWNSYENQYPLADRTYNSPKAIISHVGFRAAQTK